MEREVSSFQPEIPTQGGRELVPSGSSSRPGCAAGTGFEGRHAGPNGTKPKLMSISLSMAKTATNLAHFNFMRPFGNEHIKQRAIERLRR